jgi:hypothetical protein
MKTIIRDTIMKSALMKSRVTSGLRSALLLLFVILHFGTAQAQAPSGAMSVQSQTDYVFNETLGSDATGCYWDVTFQWSCTQNNSTNPYLFSLPHGIRLTVTGATITAPTPALNVTSGAWTSTFTSLSSTAVRWLNAPIGTDTAVPCPGPLNGAIIPYGPAMITIRVYISPSFGAQTINVETLDGYGNPSNGDVKTVPAPVIPTATPDDPSICEGKTTWIRLIPAVPSPTKIKWYKWTATNCDDSCPPAPTTNPPGAPWVAMNSNPPQVGFNNVPTNKLAKSTCYVAVMQNGCFEYLSTVAHVCVCPKLDGLGLVVTPAVTTLPITVIHNANHICDSWKGSLAINYTLCCSSKVVWTEKIDGVDQPTPDVTNLNLTSTTDTSDKKCCKQYTFAATVTNACGTKSVSWTIYVDRSITKSDVKLLGNEWDDPPTVPSIPTFLGPICYAQSARVSATPVCSGPPCEGINIVEWQDCKWTPTSTAGGSPTTWTSLPGAMGTPLYFTNKLKNPGTTIQSVWYRVKIKNGACDPVWSDAYEIQVKPKLTVSLSPLSGQMCPPTTSILLTATTDYTLGISYSWYLNGQLISTGTSNTYSATQAGYYYVIASDAVCGTSAKSQVAKICGAPKVVITGPCVACKDQKFDLGTIISTDPDGCANNCNFQWSTSNGTITSSTTGPTATAIGPGTYTVLVTCGNCTTKATIVVGPCPSTTEACDCGSWLDEPFTFVGEKDSIGTPCGVKMKLVAGTYSITLPSFECKPKDLCEAKYAWSISGPVSGSGSGQQLSFNFSAAGSYTLSVTPICNGKKCPPCVIKILVEKDCGCGDWSGEPVVFSSPSETIKSKCGDLATLQGGAYTITIPTFSCAPKGDCKPNYMWNISGPVIGSGNTTANTIPFIFSTPGSYMLTIFPICNGKECPPCKLKIIVLNDCKCGSWKGDPLTMSSMTQQYSAKCGSGLNIETGSYAITAPTYMCDPAASCATTYMWDINGPTTQNGTGKTFGFSFATPGNYTITIVPLCGGKKCPPCVIKVVVSLACDCGDWIHGKATITSPGVPPQFVTCNGSVSLKPAPYTIAVPAYICNGKKCTPQFEWSVSGAANVNGSGSMIPFNWTTPGTYAISVTPYCNGKKCAACQFTIVILPDCNCGSWLKFPITLNGPSSQMKIGCGGSVIIDNGAYTIYPNYLCGGPGCVASYNWGITGPTSATGSGYSIPYTFLLPGVYTVKVVPVCGSKTCDTCTFLVTVKPWHLLIHQSLLTGEADPVNVGLNEARAKLGTTALGAKVETWYKKLNENHAIPVMIEKHFAELRSLFHIARKMLTDDGTLEKDDVDLIDRVMKLMDSTIASAPAGLIDTCLTKLRDSVGQKWSAVLNNLIKE